MQSRAGGPGYAPVNDAEDLESPVASATRGLLGTGGSLTEEQLRSRGQTASEAERNLVTQQAEDIAMAWVQVAGRGLFCLLCCVVLPLCVAIFAVTIWAAIAVDQDAGLPCDTPVRAYVWGFIFLLCWVSWCQSLFVKCVLRYDPREDGAERPLRVQVYQTLFLFINIGWNIAGLVWVLNSKTCAETAPHMFESAKVLVFLQLTVYLMLSLVMGALLWMVWAIRHGQIKTNAAPDGFVDSLEVVAYDPAVFDDDRQPKDCPICYDAFEAELGENGPIVKTSCGHVYHKQCLGNWLNSQRTCPVCRKDLVSGDVESPSAP